MAYPRIIALKNNNATSDQYSTKGGFCLIANVIDVKLTLPVEITPSIRLDRPDQSQIELIQKLIERVEGLGAGSIRRYYEESWTPTTRGGVPGFNISPLEMKNWNYYILSFSGFDSDIDGFLSVSIMVKPYIAAFAHVHTTEEFGCGSVTGLGFDPFGSQVFYGGAFFHEPSLLDEEHINELKMQMESYRSLDPVRHEGILRAVEFHSGLQRIASLNRLKVLGYFSIIEMLLTHNPNNKEIGDSLTHQIKTKLSLLSSRLDEEFDYSSFGQNISHDGVWSALYHYRSCIAHGNNIYFAVGQLRKLKDDRTASNFIETATKKILKHALREPDLINALKPI